MISELQDQQAEEMSRVVFTVELSKESGTVQWFVDGNEVIIGQEKDRINVIAAGKKRSLVINDCKMIEDEVLIFVWKWRISLSL